MLSFDLVIPVKSLDEAKTRLSPDIARPARAALARAFALDTIDAALGASRVNRIIVVGDLRGHVDEVPAGVTVVAEPEPRSLAAAVRHGIAEARRTAGDGWGRGVARSGDDHDDSTAGRSHRGIAVLLGDLPALTAAALDAALEAASRHPLAFMPDADATGTTLATAAAHTRFEPAFGADSAAVHRALGFHDLSHELPDARSAPVRRDVDTIDALDAALQLGVGPHTAEAVAALAEGALEHSSDAAAAPAAPSAPSATSDLTDSTDFTVSTRKGAA